MFRNDFPFRKMRSIFLKKNTAFAQSEFKKYVGGLDWQDFRKWCYDNKSRYYARFLSNAAKKWSHFTFSNEFVN